MSATEMRERELEFLDFRHESQREVVREHPDWIRTGPPPPAGLGVIVFERFTPQNAGRQIFSMQSDGTDVQNLSKNPAYADGCPAWSPDRTKIVFSRATSGSGPPALWIMNSDGSGQHQLTHPPAGKWDTEPVWSADGKKIAFQRQYQIWLIDAAGTNERPLLDYSGKNVIDHMPTWKPDGAEVAFCREYLGLGVIAAAKTQVASTEQMVTLGKTGRIDGWPAWSPNGSPIAFWRNDGKDSQIWTIDANGAVTSERAISHPDTSHGQVDQAPCWSPKGDKIAFQRIDWVTPHIWEMNADGTNQQNLSAVGKPFGDPGDFFPNWA